MVHHDRNHRNIERLRRVLHKSDPLDRPGPSAHRREAAVLVPIIERAGELNLVYIRRADHIESHRGQVAFPGGRVEPSDETLLHTALREAWEEVNIEPASVDVLGGFPTMSTLTSGVVVAPFVGVLNGHVAMRPDTREVAEIFEVPIPALGDPLYRGTYEWKRDGGPPSHFPAILYGGQTIWGLTLRITERLLEIISDSER